MAQGPPKITHGFEWASSFIREESEPVLRDPDSSLIPVSSRYVEVNFSFKNLAHARYSVKSRAFV